MCITFMQISYWKEKKYTRCTWAVCKRAGTMHIIDNSGLFPQEILEGVHVRDYLLSNYARYFENFPYQAVKNVSFQKTQD